jgi:site-specific DNA-cytosine methylase
LQPHCIYTGNVPLILSGQLGETVKKEVKLKGYHVSFLILNGQDYGSLQSRRRLFIVGLSDKIASGQLSEPPKIKCIVTFEELLEHQPIRKTISENRSKLIHACVAKHPEKIFWPVHTVNSDFRNGKAGHSHVPTLTRNSRGIYWVPGKIRTTVREMLRIQGVPDSFKFPDGLSYTSCSTIIGNGMCVYTSKALLKHIFSPR